MTASVAAARGRLALLLVGLLTGAVAAAEERIHTFHSDIAVHADGSMEVTETIEVDAQGQRIRRGIYRDFPTRYRDHAGANYVVDFDIVSVRRDGTDEPYRTESRDNGVRVYIGDKDVFLRPGRYRYELTYRTDRQLGHFGERDELYWNVTGNGWAFPIERASATVTLPEGVGGTALELYAYTGPRLSRGMDYEQRVDGLGRAEFRTTRRLAAGEGLTVSVAWPAGFVARPGRGEQALYFLRDRSATLAGVAALLVLIVYYLAVWHRVGRDPDKGVIIARFRPPRGLSPAAVRYIREMGFDHRAFASAVINMAVKGYLTIEELDDEFTLRRSEAGDKSVLSPGERRLVDKLLGAGDSIRLRKSNHSTISKALKALKRHFEREFHTVYFFRNSGFLIPGILWAIGAVSFVALSQGRASPHVIFAAAWVGMWSVGVVFLWMRRQFLMAIVFTAVEGAAVVSFFQLTSPWLMALLLTLVAVNALFYYLLRAPTRLGRAIMDEIEGFKRYLEVAEESRLNALNPPERTPELFERYLPYALALGVDQQWSEKFAGVLSRAAQADEGYRPRWYSGSQWRRSGLPQFAASLGSSLTSAISSSARPPGSSSGAGGGGSSGGGGGGGGGGGW